MRYAIFALLITLVFVRTWTYSSNNLDGKTVKITGKISSEPVRYDTARMIKIQGLIAYIPLFPEVSYGDTVTVEGLVDDGKIKNPKVKVDPSSKNLLHRLRQKMIAFVGRSLPKDHAGLVAGFVLGTKSYISSDLWESLKLTGTAHVVVASGMNVTLVASSVMSILIKFMRRRKAILIALVAVWAYAVLAGFDAPIVRAAVMGSIAFAAQALGRLKSAWYTLGFSGLLMLIIWPQWVGDLGFWLSFVATGSILLFEYPLRKRFVRLPSIIREDLSTTLAAQIGVSPILYFTFGSVNLLSPIINIFVLWTVVPVTVIGFVCVLGGLIFPGVFSLILLLVYPMTTWFLFVISLFS